MKKGAFFILAFILMIGGTSCMKNPEKPKSTETSRASSSPEVPTKLDREIVEIIFSEWYPSFEKDQIVIWADEAMDDAEILSGKLFGRITSEEDALDKAEAVLIEIGWCGDDIKDERPHTAKFYDEYGVWLVDTFTLRGVINSEDNPHPISVPGSGLCTIMRITDGKVLAVWLG